MPSPVADELAHYGIPGMKWGQRKSRSGGSGGSSSSSAKLVHPKAKHLSDDELKSRIARMKLEVEYKKLTTPAPSAGRKFVQGVLTDSGKKVATEYAAKYGAKAVALAIAKATAKTAVKAAIK